MKEKIINITLYGALVFIVAAFWVFFIWSVAAICNWEPKPKAMKYGPMNPSNIATARKYMEEKKNEH